jgi:NADPH:quinone reductase-like Zn-dependent oxidoreductase
MKAIMQERFGSTDVLEVRDVPAPELPDEGILVRVHAAGCGPDVWHLMTGRPYLVRVMPGMRAMMREVRGWDVAGVVQAVGASVTGLEPGDEVMGAVDGSFAELAVGTEETLVRKPARISFEEAAAVPVSGYTALQALREAAVASGQTVLVVGAGGGVGTNLVQIASAHGAQVTGVCSGDKAELVRSLGADDVIDYTHDDFTRDGRRWDVIVDTAGRRPLRELRRALAPAGTLVIVGGDGGGRWTGGFGRQVVRAPLMSLFSGQRLRPLTAKRNRADLEALRDLIEAGKLTPVVDRTFTLDEAAQAVDYLARGTRQARSSSRWITGELGVFDS